MSMNINPTPGNEKSSYWEISSSFENSPFILSSQLICFVKYNPLVGDCDASVHVEISPKNKTNTGSFRQLDQDNFIEARS